MPVRVNSIHGVKEEVAMMRDIIADEQNIQAGIRVCSNPVSIRNRFEDYARRRAVLQDQIDALEAERAFAAQEAQEAPLRLSESEKRLQRARKRLGQLRNRTKIARIENLAKRIAELEKQAKETKDVNSRDE